MPQPLGLLLPTKCSTLGLLQFATRALSNLVYLQDKVNISVAIIPMAEDFGWSSTVSGLVQSSFFFGYMLTQIPGGYIIAKKGGRKILPMGVGLWSLATAAVPVMAGTMPGACCKTQPSHNCIAVTSCCVTFTLIRLHRACLSILHSLNSMQVLLQLLLPLHLCFISVEAALDRCFQ